MARGAEEAGDQPPGGSDAAKASALLDKFNARAASRRAEVVKRPGGLLVWRISVAVVGFVFIALGLVMLVTPGPAWLLILLGLGIWTTEFTWVRNRVIGAYEWLQRAAGWLAQRPRWMVVIAGVALIAAAAAALLVLT